MRTSLFSLLFAFSFISSANANTQFPLVSVTAQNTPGVTYTIGLQVDDNHNPLGIYYEDNSNPGGTQYYTMDTLTHNPPVLVTAQDPMNSSITYDVIKVLLNAPNFFIYYKQDVRTNNWLSKHFTVQCDALYTTCAITDVDSGQVIHSIYLPNHKGPASKFLPVPVVTGVDSIETS